jgi:MFS family permease
VIKSQVISRDFGRFWFGQTLSMFGGRVGSLALLVTAVDVLHASTSEVGILSASSMVCGLLIGLPAGVWVDRVHKRTTMILCSSVRCVTMLSVPILWWSGALHIWMLYIVALIVGTAAVFFDIAYQSYVPLLVAEGEISTANSRLEASAQVSTLGGPGLAGFLMQVVSAPVVLVIDSCAYLGSLLCLLSFNDTERRPKPVHRVKPRLTTEIIEGLRFIRDDSVISRLAVSVGVSNFFATIVTTLIPILVLRTLGFEGFMLGLIMMSGAAGGVIGALLIPSLQRVFSDGRIMAGGLITAALCSATNPIAALVGQHSMIAAGALLLVGEFGLGAGAVSFRVPQMTLRQQRCPRELMGRMNASMRYVIWGTMPFAALAAGWLGSSVGVVPTLWIGVVGAVVTVLPILGIDRIISATKSPPLGVEKV